MTQDPDNSPDPDKEKDSLEELVGTEKFLQDKIRQIEEKTQARSQLNNLERHLHCTLGLALPRYRNWIYNYKGFLSKEDGLLDYNEWHTAGLATGLAVLTHFASAFLVLYLFITAKVLKDEYHEHTTLAEIDKELPYWFGFYTVIYAVDMHLHSHEIPNQLLLAILPKLLGL